MQLLSQTLLDFVFLRLEAAAIKGERCPQMQPHGTLTREQNRAVAELARAGRIRLEIFAHNWRVITICEGPSTGKQTQGAPHHHRKPYKVIQKGDLRAGQRSAPSKPRALTDPGNSGVNPRGASG